MEFEELLMQREPEMTGLNYSGMATGIVVANWNEEAKGMVQVEMNMGEEGKTETEWLPVMQPYCGNGFGHFFLPEVNSQVVLGFLGGDTNCPIVLGCLWNDTDVLPQETANENNSLKKIQTKGGNRIELDETEGKEQIGIHTKGGISLLLQDEKQLAVMQDDKQKTMLQLDMQNGEITLLADKKLTLSVGGEAVMVMEGSQKKLTISANKIQMEGKQSMDLKSQSIKINGNMTELKAQGSMKVNCSGMLELKGSMTKIN